MGPSAPTSWIITAEQYFLQCFCDLKYKFRDQKAKLFQAIAFSAVLVPMAEVAANVVIAHHDLGMVSMPLWHHSSTVRMTVGKTPFPAAHGFP